MFPPPHQLASNCWHDQRQAQRPPRCATQAGSVGEGAISFRCSMDEEKTTRNKAIVELFKSGVPMADIARVLSISRQRVHHIIERTSSANDGGGYPLAVAMKRLDIECKKEAACLSKYGVCTKTLQQLKGIGAVQAFNSQARRAIARGIEFKLTLKDWWGIWDESGKWGLRGRGTGAYCMARNGDVGPYEVGNVTIKTVEENSSEGQYTNVKRRAKRTSIFGSGRGWTYVKKSRRRPYCVQVHGLKQKYFATQEEAEVFYKEVTTAVLSGAVRIERGELVHGGQILPASGPARIPKASMEF